MGAPQPDPRALNAAVQARIAADAKLERAKAVFWRFTGLGLAAALLGSGIGAAFFGYSYMHDNRAAATRIADAMVTALEKARLSTSGEVKLADNQTVALKPGAEVTLAPGGVVQVDPQSRVTVIGAHRAAQPTDTALVPPPASSEYTMTRSAPYRDGAVVTAWTFADALATTPRAQRCAFSRALSDGQTQRVELGADGRRTDAAPDQAAINAEEAFRACVWFPTR